MVLPEYPIVFGTWTRRNGIDLECVWSASNVCVLDIANFNVNEYFRRERRHRGLDAFQVFHGDVSLCVNLVKQADYIPSVPLYVHP